MAMQHVKATERQGGGVPVTSIPSTFARAAFPLGGIGTGTVSLGARGELRDWELVNSPAKGCRPANSCFAIHARPEGGVAVNRVLGARIGGDPRRDQQGGFGVYDLAGLPRLAAARLIGEHPIARVEFEDPELPVRVALAAFTPFVPLDADASGIPATVLRYSVTNPGDVPVSVTIAGSLSHLAGEAKNFDDFTPSWFARPVARQTSAWRDDGEFRGLDFGVDLDPGDKAYGTMSLMTRAERVTKKPEWVRSFVGTGAELFWRDFAADGLLDEADEAPVEEVMAGTVPARTTGSLGLRRPRAGGDPGLRVRARVELPQPPELVGLASHRPRETGDDPQPLRHDLARCLGGRGASAPRAAAARGGDAGVPRRPVLQQPRPGDRGRGELDARRPAQHDVLPHRGRVVPRLGGELGRGRQLLRHVHPRVELRTIGRVAVPRAGAQRAAHRVHAGG
jgi:hypothetical protein